MHQDPHLALGRVLADARAAAAADLAATNQRLTDHMAAIDARFARGRSVFADPPENIRAQRNLQILTVSAGAITAALIALIVVWDAPAKIAATLHQAEARAGE